ncbi:histone-lysine N-methyltransferase SETMAR [Paramormyrops kingsleyae]|uniref:histone-lysine N-methyltransferase SETMAR n=1 Tax=Paramormyrops kingsleyae TaxID=1676925 RepID=UPI000CD62138|nr:histone-lysine N-methyltransferase SETMAR [Paramormyrops kingsleyae]
MNCITVEDLSHGTENVPVLFEGTVRKETPVFQYTPENVPGPGCDSYPNEVTLPGCDCRSHSCQQGSCSCLQHHGQLYNSTGHLLDRTDELTGYSRPVFECNTLCRCGESCSNRLVQQGLKLSLCVFPTQGKGCGVRTLEPVSRGSFVCEYAGEVIGFEEACRRQRVQSPDDMNYIIAVREHAGTDVLSETFVDPAAKGNVGRFLNHSCQPNLVMVPVRVHSMVPRLALFATCDIAPLEELTFDYSGGYKKTGDVRIGLGPGEPISATGGTDLQKRKPCLCGTQNCRLFLPLDVSVISSS